MQESNTTEKTTYQNKSSVIHVPTADVTGNTGSTSAQRDPKATESAPKTARGQPTTCPTLDEWMHLGTVTECFRMSFPSFPQNQQGAKNPCAVPEN